MTSHGEDVGADNLAILTNDVAGRHERAVAGLGDDFLGKTCGFVGLSLIGGAFHDVAELQATGIFGNDNGIERIPTGNELALLHLFATLEIEA